MILHCVIKQELGLILYVIKVDICSRVNPDHQHAKYPSTKPLYLSPKNHLTPHVLFHPPPAPPQHGTLSEGNIYKQIVLILFVTQKWLIVYLLYNFIGKRRFSLIRIWTSVQLGELNLSTYKSIFTSKARTKPIFNKCAVYPV